MRMLQTFSLLSALCALPFVAGCGEDAIGSGNEGEVITTVTLTFTPDGGGAPITAAFDDPDGDGGDPPTVDEIVLVPGDYRLTVAFANNLETPPEDITAEVADESDQHQLFFTGTAVDGPATDHAGAPLRHAYADTDATGLPVGLASDVTASSGTGSLTVTLRHLPPASGAAVKVAGLAETVAAGSIADLPGETDASVTFPVTVIVDIPS